jgi:hypothetical protein
MTTRRYIQVDRVAAATAPVSPPVYERSPNDLEPTLILCSIATHVIAIDTSHIWPFLSNTRSGGTMCSQTSSQPGQSKNSIIMRLVCLYFRAFEASSERRRPMRQPDRKARMPTCLMPCTAAAVAAMPRTSACLPVGP